MLMLPNVRALLPGPTTTSVSTIMTSTTQAKGGLSTGAVVGIIIAVIGIVVVLVAVTALIM